MPPRLRGDSLGERVAHLGGSALFIQGPPGSGKTYTGARLICELLAARQRVGVAATSHKAIANLLAEVERAAAEAGVDFRGLKKSGGGNPESHYESAHVASSADAAAFPPGDEVTLIAGTPWLWAREELRGAVDVLFVDEAGQMALADALAIAGAGARHGAARRPAAARAREPGHPPARLGRLGARAPARRPRDRAAGRGRVPRAHVAHAPRRLPLRVDARCTTGAWRPSRAPSASASPRPASPGAGVRLLEVEHAENRQSAPEEADRIAEEVAKLLDGGRYTDMAGEERDLTLEDILVVAPFNAQVRCLRERLPRRRARRHRRQVPGPGGARSSSSR